MRSAIYKHFPAYQYQKGVTLIEVLVSMVLMAVIGLGAAYISGRTAVMQRDQNIHLHTVNQMRQQLEDSSKCSGKSTGTHEVEIQVAGINIDLDWALLHKDLKCKAPLIEPNLRRNLGKWAT